MIDFPIIDSHIHLLDQKRFGYAWASGAPALKRDWTPDDLAAAAKPYRDRRLGLRRGRRRHAAISRRGGTGSTSSPNATVACSAPSPACRWKAAPRSSRRWPGIAELKSVRGVRRLIQNQPDPDYRAEAGVPRSDAAPAEIQSLVRHLRLPSAIAEHAEDDAPLSRGRLRPRSHRQARDQGGSRRSLAGPHPRDGGAAECRVQALRRHHRGRSQVLDARAIAALHRPRRSNASAPTAFSTAATGRSPNLPAAISQWLVTLDWATAGFSSADKRKLFRDNAIKAYRLSV